MVWLDFSGDGLVSVVGAYLNRFGLGCFGGSMLFWRLGFFESMWVGCFGGIGVFWWLKLV